VEAGMKELHGIHPAWIALIRHRSDSNASPRVMASALLAAQLVLAVTFSAPLSAQECTPHDITLGNQAEVNNFQANHGPCDRMGNLRIEGPDIVNLDGLAAIKAVEDLWIVYNDALTDLSGLSALGSAREISIGENPQITNVDFLSHISSVSGFVAINDAASLTNLHGLSKLTSVGEDLYIANIPKLSSLDGLSSLVRVGALNISSNDALTNLDGLSSLSSVDYLSLFENDALTNVDALSNITSLIRLDIYYNAVLTNLNGLSALASVNRNLNGANGDLNIGHNPALSNLDGLAALTNVSHDLWIGGNGALTNLSGLSDLSSVGGTLSIQSNISLTSLGALSALQEVRDNLELTGNTSLGDCRELVELVDALDDYQPGPGPGPSGIPDIGLQATFSNNLVGCNSVEEILADAPLFEINAGLNDAWKNPATPGQGFFVNVFPDIGQVFLGWFTYDLERPAQDTQAILGEAGHRWLTAFGPYLDGRALLDIELTQGGVFDAAEPVPTQELDGTIILEFTTCNAGTVTYDIPSIALQGTIPIERIALDNVPACELLSGAVR
jgi:hypothetical protein